MHPLGKSYPLLPNTLSGNACMNIDSFSIAQMCHIQRGSISDLLGTKQLYKFPISDISLSLICIVTFFYCKKYRDILILNSIQFISGIILV